MNGDHEGLTIGVDPDEDEALTEDMARLLGDPTTVRRLLEKAKRGERLPSGLTLMRGRVPIDVAELREVVGHA